MLNQLKREKIVSTRVYAMKKIAVGHASIIFVTVPGRLRWVVFPIVYREKENFSDYNC